MSFYSIFLDIHGPFVALWVLTASIPAKARRSHKSLFVDLLRPYRDVLKYSQVVRIRMHEHRDLRKLVVRTARTRIGFFVEYCLV